MNSQQLVPLLTPGFHHIVTSKSSHCAPTPGDNNTTGIMCGMETGLINYDDGDVWDTRYAAVATRAW